MSINAARDLSQHPQAHRQTGSHHNIATSLHLLRAHGGGRRAVIIQSTIQNDRVRAIDSLDRRRRVIIRVVVTRTKQLIQICRVAGVITAALRRLITETLHRKADGVAAVLSRDDSGRSVGAVSVCVVMGTPVVGVHWMRPE